ncbi:ergosterol 28 [Xylona heveae TC161]|uniref:Ergosterol 28 n=1 Tax=Xylona heveae (strain CBS 132557 / TC161) TaxID=1328760 RepID=A0A165ITR2_XYLHT|nr:ergosterol 28 [Xylona heveae TC161]KZF25378.1 ergosterol 28 [Xylona heveae TC161]
MSAYLPPHTGLLPKWLLLISVVSVANSVQTYLTLNYTQKVYEGSPKTGSKSPVTPLSARTFGTWTFLSSIIRLWAAYNIDNPQVYQLALWTFGVALGHFSSEWLVYGTAKWGKGLAGPAFVSTGTLLWMVSQWSYYVQ